MSDKICPKCRTKNSLNNLKCVKCEADLLYVPVEKFWNEKDKNKKFDRNYILEEIFTLPFILSCIIGVFFAFIAVLTANPFWLAISIIVVGYNFIPKERDFLSHIIEWLEKRKIKK